MVTPKITREQWLEQAVHLLRPLFKQAKQTIPKKVRISVGFPYASRKAEGECWYTTCSADGANEIFISPKIAKPESVLDILVHELCHTVAGAGAKHGKAFKVVTTAVGLEGKITATHAGPELVVVLHRIAKTLGSYPHAVLTPRDKPKQSTRLILLECDCGLKIRITQKWLDEIAGAGKSAGCWLCGNIMNTPAQKDLK